jgi:hypothetical protein
MATSGPSVTMSDRVRMMTLVIMSSISSAGLGRSPQDASLQERPEGTCWNVHSAIRTFVLVEY